MSNITIRDVYQVSNEIKNELVKITDDHEKRIRVVEGNQSKMFGVLAAISFAVGFAGDYLRSLIFGKS